MCFLRLKIPDSEQTIGPAHLPLPRAGYTRIRDARHALSSEFEPKPKKSDSNLDSNSLDKACLASLIRVYRARGSGRFAGTIVCPESVIFSLKTILQPFCLILTNSRRLHCTGHATSCPYLRCFQEGNYTLCATFRPKISTKCRACVGFSL